MNVNDKVKQKLHIFDFDGTLVHNYDHPWVGEGFNWDTFISTMTKQPAVETVGERMKEAIADPNSTVVLCSARPDDSIYQMMTLNQLVEFGVDVHRIDHVCFRNKAYIRAEQSLTANIDNPDDVKRIIHECHKQWRLSKVDYMRHEFKPEEVICYDDQQKNLDAWVEAFATSPYTTSLTNYLVEEDGTISGTAHHANNSSESQD